MTKTPTHPDEENSGKCYHDDWPQALREMTGCWTEFPQQEELRAGLGADVQREPITEDS